MDMANARNFKKTLEVARVSKGVNLLLIVLLAIPLRQILPAFLSPKPVERPEGFPEGQGGWPLYFAPLAFTYNRSFGTFFVLGLVADTLLRVFTNF